jgi:hypothetical protein
VCCSGSYIVSVSLYNLRGVVSPTQLGRDKAGFFRRDVRVFAEKKQRQKATTSKISSRPPQKRRRASFLLAKQQSTPVPTPQKMAPTTRATAKWATSRVVALPEFWTLVAEHSGLVGAWRLMRVCVAAREGAKAWLRTLPGLLVCGGCTAGGDIERRVEAGSGGASVGAHV